MLYEKGSQFFSSEEDDLKFSVAKGDVRVLLVSSPKKVLCCSLENFGTFIETLYASNLNDRIDIES